MEWTKSGNIWWDIWNCQQRDTQSFLFVIVSFDCGLFFFFLFSLTSHKTFSTVLLLSSLQLLKSCCTFFTFTCNLIYFLCLKKSASFSVHILASTTSTTPFLNGTVPKKCTQTQSCILLILIRELSEHENVNIHTFVVKPLACEVGQNIKSFWMLAISYMKKYRGHKYITTYLS